MKFILIDNSIIDTVGHHYQYAMSCLKAAESLGFEPILASNIKHDDYNAIPWKTFPIYHYGFWTGEEQYFGKRIYQFFKKISQLKNRKDIERRIKKHYSVMGFYKELGGMLPGFLTKPLDPNSLVTISKFSLLLKIFLFGGPFLTYQKLNQKFSESKIKSKWRSLLDQFINLTKIEPLDPLSGSRILKYRTKAFANDTKQLFNKIGLGENDHVFIPNTGTAEILGLTTYLKNKKRNQKINWHLLFRRNLYHGTRLNYYSEVEVIRPFKNLIQNLLSVKNNDNIFFHADTDELVNQFNSMNLMKFTTTPIPHTNPSSSHKFKNDQIVISYLGDARTEKGYQFLPQIIKDLYAYMPQDKVIFKIQSNFNIKDGEIDPRIARNELIDLQSKNVELLFEPLSTQEYNKFLLNSDIILLPYQSTNYFARSSGILCEALTAGIPVVVPSKTWMSRQFQKQIYEYQVSLRDKLKIISTFNGDELYWHEPKTKTETKKFKNDTLFFGSHNKRIITQLKIQNISSHFLIYFTFVDDTMNSIVCFYVNQYDSHHNLIKKREYHLEKAPGCQFGTIFGSLEEEVSGISIEIKNPETENLSQIQNLRIDLLENDKKFKKIPIGVIGGIYLNNEEISECLQDMIDNNSHYLKTAIAFSKEYYQFHNSTTLIKLLTDSNKNENKVKISASPSCF